MMRKMILEERDDNEPEVQSRSESFLTGLEDGWKQLLKVLPWFIIILMLFLHFMC